MAVCRGRCPHRPAGFCAGLSVNHRVIARARTAPVAIRPQSLPCLKGGGPAAGWWRDLCGEESPSHGFAVLRQGDHQPLRRFAHLPLHRGRLFIPLLRLPPANLPRDRCRFPSYNRPTAHAPSARNFRRLRTLTAGADSPSPAKWRAHPCG